MLRMFKKYYLNIDLQERENLEPIFDLFDYDLKSMPSGVYMYCKIVRKERLYFQVVFFFYIHMSVI